MNLKRKERAAPDICVRRIIESEIQNSAGIKVTETYGTIFESITE